MFPSIKHVPLEAISSYKAAGIVPFHSSFSSSSSFSDGWFLVGRDTRRKFRGASRVWCDFGGKIDRKLDGNDPWSTAVREYGEETEGALASAKWSPQEEHVRGVVWNKAGSYLLFLAECPSFRLSKWILPAKSEKDCLAWVRGKDLLDRSLQLPTPAALLPMKGYLAPDEGAESGVDVVAFPFFLYSFRIIAESSAKQ